MASKNRSKSTVEIDFIAEHDMLTAISDLLISASKSDNTISNKTLQTVGMYLEGHLENLETYFVEMTTLAGGSEYYKTEKNHE